jgi:hypothetical protein
MKRILFSFAVAAAALTACNKEAPVHQGQSTDKVELSVGIDGISTRATGIMGDATDEAKVQNIHVFVFNGEIVDGYGTATDGSTTLTIGCTAGSREIYAVVNASAADDLANVTSKTQFLAKSSELAEDVDMFEMIGKKTVDTKVQSSVTVEVDRFAARVVVRKVTNALTSPALKNQTFELVSMHLTNATGDINYGKTVDPTVWYNKMGVKTGLGSYTDDAIGEEIAPAASYGTAHYFYSYPNGYDVASDYATWSERRSILVLKVKIGTTLYDYPIVLPAFAANNSYEIDEIKITRPGNVDDGKDETNGGSNEDEQVPVEGADCQFTITVNPWNVVLDIDGDGVADGPITI